MNLLHAIRLLDLDDSDIVHLAKRPQQDEAYATSVRQLRNRFDLRSIEVRKINPWHYRYCSEIYWEFVIEHWEDVTGLNDYSKPKPIVSPEIRKTMIREHIRNKKSV